MEVIAVMTLTLILIAFSVVILSLAMGFLHVLRDALHHRRAPVTWGADGGVLVHDQWTFTFSGDRLEVREHRFLLPDRVRSFSVAQTYISHWPRQNHLAVCLADRWISFPEPPSHVIDFFEAVNTRRSQLQQRPIDCTPVPRELEALLSR
jgi:hypothetical protein